ncbi:MAG: DegT/DnrJ/EryC1/StrS family aminotransferase [Alphaproteobacteria bacterium]|nr:MAG: DegT/DnrJ/EryC1/StrS family aminotransferase [Alphaproteobacteria bacterium]
MNRHARIDSIPFIDVVAQRRRLGSRIDEAVRNVMDHCQFINGPEVGELERALSEFCGAKHSIGVASGTDALVLVLMAKRIGPGDAVICPSFTYAASPEAVALAGATPVFCEVDENTFNIDPGGIERAVAAAKRAGLKPKALMTVDLFGLPADYEAIDPVAEALGLYVIDDAAQAFGADARGRKVGTLAPLTTTSFFPAKPLGCYGDGGAVFTDDDELADLIRSLRNHGQGTDRYDNVRVGMTGRLDTIQAAVLIEKLKIFPEEIVARERIARRYNAALADVVRVPHLSNEHTCVWAQYTIRVSGGRRDALADALKADGIPTAQYYPVPSHRQGAYRDRPVAEGGLAVTERLAGEVISLPMHAYLDEPSQDRIIGAVREALRH